MADDDLIVRAQLRDELSAGLRGIQGELAKTRAAAAGLGIDAAKGSAALGGVEVAAGRSRAALSDLDSGLKSASTTVTGLFVSGLTKAGTALGVLTGGLAFFGLKASSQFQQSKIAFDALLGSVDKGNALFAQLQQLNIKTPFQLNEIAPATQLLLRYGVAADSVVPVLKSLLDAAALSGDPAANLQRLALATGQIVSQGRLLGQDARQLAESGINAYDLFAQKLGITQDQARKLGQAGKLSSDVFIQGLINMEGPLAKLQGGAEKLSGTLVGQLSNLKDALRVRLADAAQPLTEQLTKMIAPITEVVGTAVDQLGPPVFQMVGLLVQGLQAALPIVAPLIALIVAGFGQLLTAAGPALQALGPLGGEIGKALTEMFTALVPVMPDVVRLLVAMVGILPDFIRLLTDLIPIIDPMVRLVTGMLGFDSVRQVLSVLLLGLLAYNRVSEVIGGLRTFAAVLGIVGTTAETTGVQAGIAYGRLAALGALAVGGAGVVAGAPGAVSGKGSVGSDAEFIGGAALAGGAAGSVIPGVGTLIGAGAGALVAGTIVGLGKIFGDPAVPGGTAARHAAAAGSNSMLQITSGQRNWGLSSGASGHLKGTAVDVVGPGLVGYAQRVQRQGGWAVLENHGGVQHAHADFGDPAPTSRAAAGGGAGAPSYQAIFTGPINGIRDLEAAVRQIFEEIERDRYERAYEPLYGRVG